jgi:hypothetical protein
MKMRHLFFSLVICLTITGSCTTDTVQKKVILDAGQLYQTIDGFGVNITPAQWRDGNLKPELDPEDYVPALKAIIRKMIEKGLDDVRLIVMGDSYVFYPRLEAILNQPELKNHIHSISVHTYGDGFDQDWFTRPSDFGKAQELINHSAYKGIPLWIGEYGDLDQTGEVEFYVGWKSTRRLLKFLNDGVSAAMVWDAFTIVGMSNVESDVELTVELKNLSNNLNGKEVYYYRTSRYEDCCPVGSAKLIDNQFKLSIPERSIFTLTTLKVN